MALLLHIETATERGSVAVSRDDRLLSLAESQEDFRHTRDTTLLVEQALSEAQVWSRDLHGVSLSQGPGSYTALRVGASVAKGLCYALDVPLVAIDTLEALANAASQQYKADLYVPMIDARRMEVYTAFYDAQLLCVKPQHALVLSENTFAVEREAKQRIVLTGNGAAKIAQIQDAQQYVFAEILCSATHLIPLAARAFRAKNFANTAYFEPFYLKPPNITRPKKVL